MKKKIIDILISIAISTVIFFLQQLLSSLQILQVSDPSAIITGASGGFAYILRAFRTII